MNIVSLRNMLLLMISCSFMLFIGCNDQKSSNENSLASHVGYSIQGIILNNQADMLYLVDKNEKRIDSSKIINNSFALKGIIDNPSTFNLVFENQRQPFSVLLENTGYNLLINQNDMMIAGGDLNTRLIDYKSMEASFDTQRLKALNNFSESNISEKELRASLDSIVDVASNYALGFIEENKDNSLSSMALASHTFPLETLLSLTESTKDASNTQLVSALGNSVAALQKAEEERITAEKKAAKIVKVYRAPAPLFSGESLSGPDVALASVLQGKKAVLIDFWASWCQPCRMVTPEVRYLYQRYNKLGFDIITVSEDKNRAAWRQGVQEDQMTAWNHIYDNRMSIASMYGARAIPHMVLVDENGNIIKDKISITQLKRELTKIFK